MPATDTLTLAQVKPGITTPMTLCTSPSGKDTIVRTFEIMNVSATPTTITVWIGQASDPYLALKPLYLLAGESASHDGPLILDENTPLLLQTSEANTIVALVQGVEVPA